MKINVNNWEKYNSRKDVKSATWFRLQNDLWLDMKFATCDCVDLMVFIALLSLASKKQKSEIHFDPGTFAGIRKTTPSKVNDALEKLEALGCIEFINNNTTIGSDRKKNVTLRGPTESVPTDRQTDEQTDGQTDTSRGKGEAIVTVVENDPGDIALAKDWLSFSLSGVYGKNVYPSWNVENFAKAIKKVRKNTIWEGKNLTVDGVRLALNYIVNDPTPKKIFQKNCRTPEALLKKWESGRPIDQILNDTKNKPKTRSEENRDVVKKYLEKHKDD